MIKIINGDLFDSTANFIVHQVNCKATMGAGVAKQVADLFPHVEQEYIRYCNFCKEHGIDLLGAVQYVPIKRKGKFRYGTLKNTDYQYIVNLFGQRGFGSGLQTDLNALRKGFINIRFRAKAIGASVAMPYRIGSFRGGADWDDVYNIIKEVFEDSSVDVEIWNYDIE